ncbi:hypothetical protein [Pseudomonas sp. RIT-PI-S]|uniref:hypothetical protein n=1 Tax=Pseudomonas sp. RIT-PI-S TaxID=3035295 RepID=UPI0021D8F83E|nr:hypothetical protein [Pseudomonas sp. RIT-PI-S]
MSITGALLRGEIRKLGYATDGHWREAEVNYTAQSRSDYAAAAATVAVKVPF